jgi:tripartite-type tricarboxylate transporter receptor subunit TctC
MTKCKSGRDRLRTLIAAIGCSLLAVGAAASDSYPSRPITMVLPFAAGGPTDTLARILANRMRVALGQPVIVLNVTGAAGTIGVGRVAHAAADGYTIGVGPMNAYVLTGATYKLPFDLIKDFEPIALLASNPSVVVAKNAVPAKTLKELIAWVKASQDKISAGTTGVGSATHLGGLLFQNMTGTRFQFIPYRGAGPAMQDLVAGQIELMFDQLSNSLPHVRSSSIKAYAVMSRTRAAAAPEIPTVDEAGLPGFYMPVWHGMWVPKGTPKDVIDKLNKAVIESLADPVVTQRFAELGQEIPPAAEQSPSALGAFHKAEIDKWWPIIKTANINAE